MVIAGVTVIAAIAIFSLMAPVLMDAAPNATDWDLTYASPGSSHLFGTDALGRDILIRTAYGIRISILIGILSTAVSLIIGLIWGSIAGYSGGRVDSLMMRFVDIMYGLPFMFFVIILIVFFGRNIYNLFIAIGAVQWLTMSRIVRGQVLSLKNRQFIESARSLGQSDIKIMVKHIIPNLMGPVLAYAFLLIPTVIIEESFLSFLGLGVQPPDASLGNLISYGAGVMENYWWMLIFPAAFLILILFALNFLGEGLRESFDPRP